MFGKMESTNKILIKHLQYTFGKNQLFEICKSKFSLVLFDHIIAIIEFIEIYNPSEIKKSKAKSNETSKDKWFVKKMNGQIIAERKMIKSKII